LLTIGLGCSTREVRRLWSAIKNSPNCKSKEELINEKEKVHFWSLAEQIRLILLRNGAFLFNIDENLEYPGTLRMEMLLSSWAQHLLQLSRMAKPESKQPSREQKPLMSSQIRDPLNLKYFESSRLVLWTAFSLTTPRAITIEKIMVR
jgi:hypothetical protein